MNIFQWIAKNFTLPFSVGDGPKSKKNYFLFKVRFYLKNFFDLGPSPTEKITHTLYPSNHLNKFCLLILVLAYSRQIIQKSIFFLRPTILYI